MTTKCTKKTTNINPTDGLITREQICTMYKVTPASIRNWEKQGLICVFTDKSTNNTKWYDPAHVTEWYSEHFNKSESLDQAELRRKVADANLAEIKVLKLRGELVSIDNVVSIIAQELSNVRSRLIALPGMIAPHIYVDDMAIRLKIIEDAVNNILDEISTDTITTTQWKELLDTDAE